MLTAAHCSQFSRGFKMRLELSRPLEVAMCGSTRHMGRSSLTLPAAVIPWGPASPSLRAGLGWA